jgi:hypothetical protein
MPPIPTAPAVSWPARLQLATALMSAAVGDVDPIRARLEQLPPDLLAAAIHRADLVAVIAEDIQRERHAARDRHPAGRALEPDRVRDAFFAECLRQHLTECEIDGVRWEYRHGRWLKPDDTTHHAGR